MTSSGAFRRRLNPATSDFDLDGLARPALVGVVVLSGLLIYHLTRGSSFLADDWTWIVARRGSSLHTFLAPYNGHLSLVPLAIYRLMFAAFGIGDFAPYRVLLLVVAAATGVVIFEYARHRLGQFGALLVTALLMFLGPGWNDILQPFQIAWLIAVAGGILALSLLDRRRTGTDLGACILILISIATTSVGVALAIGIAVDIALGRRRWRDAWIVGLPLMLYALWAVHYHPSQIQISSLTHAPVNFAATTASGLAGAVGLSGVTPTDMTGLSLSFGVPLLGLAVAAVIARARTGWDWTRFLSLAAALVTFSLLTTLARSFQSPFESRYIYVVCVVEALMAVELARNLSVPFRGQVALAALTLVAVVSNIGILRSGGSYFRGLGALTDATLTALELDRDRVASAAPLTQLPLYPLVVVTAGQYFNAERALGTPAYTVAQLLRATPAARGAADAQSLADRVVKLASVAAAPPSSGDAPPVEAAGGGSITPRKGCVAFTPAAALAPGQASTVALGLRPGRVSVTAGLAPVTISVRRFAPVFTALGAVRARGAAIVSVSGDRAPQPWYLQVQSVAPMQICGLSPT